MHISFHIFLGAVVAYGLVLLLMFLFQRQLLYFPDRALQSPETYNLKEMQLVELYTADNEIIHGWYAPPTGKKETILYFHGNRGHIGDRAVKLRAFLDAGYGLLALSWRGYGTSSGAPTEAGLFMDGRAAMQWLTGEKKVPLDQVILFGESLGSGPAVKMATEYKVGLTVLEAPYLSVRQRAQELYRWLPVRMLLIDDYDSLKIIRTVKSPIVILHGERDTVIPLRHGKTLFAEAPEPKRLLLFPSVGHTDFSPKDLIWAMESGLGGKQIPVMVVQERRKHQ